MKTIKSIKHAAVAALAQLTAGEFHKGLCIGTLPKVRPSVPVCTLKIDSPRRSGSQEISMSVAVIR